MRLLIDTRYLPIPPATDLAGSSDSPALALVLAAIAAPAQYSIHLWLPASAPAATIAARRAWEAYLPHQRLHAAPLDPNPLLQAAAIAALAPDLFWLPTPAALTAKDADLSVAPPPILPGIATLASTPPCPDLDRHPHDQVQGRPQLARYWQWLKTATSIWCDDPAHADQLRDCLLIARDRLSVFTATASAARAAELLAVHRELQQPRPTLAYLSPLPPARSGIADYSAELLPELAVHYAITLVNVDPTTDPWLDANFPVIDIASFNAQAHRFKRILYHVGNSEYHAHMVALLAEHPGVLVLHDFYLGHLHGWRQALGGEPGALVRALRDSHGWPALACLARDGQDAAIWHYPANRDIMATATGVIVHSNHSRALTHDWLGPEPATCLRQIPHLRRLPRLAPNARAQARAALELGARDFIVCSFGFLGPAKCNQLLLDAWEQSPLANNADAHLVFVGQNHDGDDGQRIAARLRTWRGARPPRITGYASPGDYRLWLAAADVAVQLRQNSRGETSGTVLDCLAHGLPLIVNDHGSMSDLPADSIYRLPDPPTAAALRAALDTLHADPAARTALAEHGRATIAAHHHPPRIAAAYRDAIESFVHASPGARHQRHIASLAPNCAADPAAFATLAESLALLAPTPGPARCYLDITALRLASRVTGIERVTQALLDAFLADPLLATRVTPVYATAEGYREAWGYVLSRLGLPPALLPDALILPRPGELFLGLDWVPGEIVRQRQRLAAWRARGLRCWFLVHDILPMTNPEWFPAHMPPHFRAWLMALAELADGCVCVSGATAAALGDWWAGQGVAQPPRLRVSHNGADFPPAANGNTASAPRLPPALATALAARPSLLMVGTLEPRKGHRHAIHALQRLWADGHDLNLIIVGGEGWLDDSQADRAPIVALAHLIRQHPEHGKRLFWPSSIDDASLAALYCRATALLAAAENEGFGLPLIEAAHHHLPLIARDIPVFREIAGDHAWYFPANAGPDGQALAASLSAWLSAQRAGQAPSSSGLRALTWVQSAACLRDILLADLNDAAPHLSATAAPME
ncbi:glycosyltransferase [Rhabdochromatium marinum]|uniref:glycosyltransferase n=1 Tax=Rhabdochromatium marinum TaxID=48729 RepID=UPI0019073A6A|nr:glycosyltransferase [Rhabdochromatium marinum]